MTLFPIHPETLKVLYANGHITSAALIAIAPPVWLAKHYPELLKQLDQASEAIAPTLDSTESLNVAQNSNQRTCASCIHFASSHRFCKTRVDESNTYLAVERNTPACIDFQSPKLPNFLRD